eukprot:SM000172S03051  [mRNA]  locus=s172:13074:14469:+ [translate_table: standard]
MRSGGHGQRKTRGCSTAGWRYELRQTTSSGSPAPRVPKSGGADPGWARSVPIKVVAVTKSRSPGAQLLLSDYAERLRHYCNVAELVVRPNPKNSSAQGAVTHTLRRSRFILLPFHHIRPQWGRRIRGLGVTGPPLQASSAPGQPDLRAGLASWAQVCCSDVAVQVQAEGERVVLVDERGRTITSEQLASLIADVGDTSAAALVFCIGGPYGHGPAVTVRADTTVSLSALVLNHEIAAVVLMEQLYRSWTILRGEKYHHS